jgi:hypothetical protein
VPDKEVYAASMTLVEILKAHQEIAQALDSSVPNQNDYRFAGLAAIIEVAEALQNLPWRPWRARDRRSPTEDELEAALPELADAAGALFRMVVNLGIPPERFARACEEHIAEKWRRINLGVDQ